MRRDVSTAIKLLAIPTAALVFVIAFAPGRLELAVRVYALAACAVALGFGIVWLHRVYPPTSPLRDRSQARPDRARPTALTRLENEVVLGVAKAFDLHRRLAPRLRSLAQGLLASRRGVSLDAQPTRARAILGEETWEVVRPDRPVPSDRRAPGIPRKSLVSVVESLENV